VGISIDKHFVFEIPFNHPLALVCSFRQWQSPAPTYESMGKALQEILGPTPSFMVGRPMTGQHHMHWNLKLPPILNTSVVIHVTLTQLVHEFPPNRPKPERFRHRDLAPVRTWARSLLKLDQPLIQDVSPFQDFGCAWPSPACSL
jgi:hypothetical protein